MTTTWSCVPPIWSLGRLLEPLGNNLAASWELLGGSSGVLERLMKLLGTLRRVFRASWRVLRASWEPLGASWERLGRLLGVFWSHFGRFGEIFGPQQGLGKHLGSDCLELWKTIKNTVRYCKNEGSEGEKSAKNKAEINLESVFTAEYC